MKTTTLWISIVSGLLLLGAACQHEDKKDMGDYIEEEMMRKLARDMLFPTTAFPCAASQFQVRFSNASGVSQSFTLFSNGGCTTKSISVSTTVASGTTSAFKCANVLSNGAYPAQDSGAGCGATPFLFTAGNSYTVTSVNGGYYFDAVY